jgi:hypothetical protein
VITHVLGWQPGDRLTLTAGAGVVFARHDPYDMVTVKERDVEPPAGRWDWPCGGRS